MAGFSKLYVLGGEGGHGGADGVNPIRVLILVGDASRQWLEPRYLDASIRPLGQLRTIVPADPNDPEKLLDACIAFCPQFLAPCRSMAEVEAQLGNAERLDFHSSPESVPAAWSSLRREARKRFSSLNIWQADLVRLEQQS